MDYENASKLREKIDLLTRLRLAAWHIASHRRRTAKVLDPRHLSDHVLNDIGLQRPNEPWDDSVGFWRGN